MTDDSHRSRPPSVGGAPTDRGARPSPAAFRLFVTARAVSRFGDGVVPVALSAGLVLTGHGISSVSYALGAWTAAFGGFVLLGGVLTDRFSPRRTMVFADVLRVLAAGLLAVAFGHGDPALWLVYALSAVGGLGAALFQPGIAGTIAAIATDAQRANGVVRSAESLMTIAGPGVAALLVAAVGAAGLYAVDAASFGLSALCLYLTREGPPARGHGKSLLRDLVEGWREFRRRRWLWAVIAIWTGYSLTVLGPMVPLQNVLITQTHGATALGVIMAVFGAGSAAGGLLAMRTRPRRPLASGTVALSGVSVHLLALSMDAPLPVLGVAVFAGGAGLMYWIVMWSTALQTHIPPHAISRLSAYEMAGSVLPLAGGRALAGPADAWLSARAALLLCALLNCAVMTALFAVPAIRRLPNADGGSARYQR
ncbi:MFS transporter [Streptomyces canus]|uniref:MFS transporter n=1 Tax=Streptomyces canus TaxID=58343 RepID=UPI002E27CDDD|nr:MFS transporter [Streptomyces canus]